MSLLYFRNGGVIGNDEARALGMAEQYLSPSMRQVHGGPGGASGLVWCFGPGGRELGFWKEQQTWVNTGPDANGQSVWIGWKEQPGPDALVRRRTYDGPKVRLGDGHEWIFPRVQTLPKALGYDERGEKRMYLEPRFRPALDAWEALARLVTQEGERPEADWLEDTLKIAAVFLSLNYLVGAREIVALRLVTFEGLGDIAHAMLDA